MPDEGLWVAIVVLDEVVDGGFEFLGGTVDAAAELAFGEQREPAFDQIEPRSAGRSEVHVDALVTRQPGLHRGVLVRRSRGSVCLWEYSAQSDAGTLTSPRWCVEAGTG